MPLVVAYHGRMPTRRLIVNADDFGLSGTVNAGIEAAHRRGVLTSATLMANGPAFDEAVEMAKANPELGVGAHLNLVRGRPLSPGGEVRVLIDAGGSFTPFRWRRLVPDFMAAAEREYRRQIERILAAGIIPTHVDFEKHHAWQGGLYALACRVAEEYGIRAVRNLAEPVWWALKAMGWPGARRFAMASCLRAGLWLSPAEILLAKPDLLLGQLHIGRLDEKAWLALIPRLPPGTHEVMTHPGNDAPLGARGEMGASWLAEGRKIELDALLSRRVRTALREADIELVNYRALPGVAEGTDSGGAG